MADDPKTLDRRALWVSTAASAREAVRLYFQPATLASSAIRSFISNMTPKTARRLQHADFFPAVVLISLIVFLISASTAEINVEALLLAIITILALMAIGLWRRPRVEHAEDIYARLKDLFEPLLSEGLARSRQLDLLRPSDLPPFEEYIEGAQEIFCAGGSLGGVIEGRFNLLKKLLEEGKSLKFLLQNPENEGLKHVIVPGSYYAADLYVHQLERSIERLRALKEIPGAKLDARLADYYPAQSISILDGHLGGRKLIVHLLVPGGDSGTSPNFLLERQTHPEWFEFFYHHYYSNLWEGGKPI